MKEPSTPRNRQHALHIQLLVGFTVQADYPQVIRLGRQVIEGYPENMRGQMFAHYYLGRVPLAQGDLAQAEACLHQATSVWSPEHETDFVVSTLTGLVRPLMGWAALYARQGKLPQAPA